MYIIPMPNTYATIREAADTIKALREALEPFARMAIMDDRLSGLNPEQMRHHVAKARKLLSRNPTDG